MKVFLTKSIFILFAGHHFCFYQDNGEKGILIDFQNV